MPVTSSATASASKVASTAAKGAKAADTIGAIGEIGATAISAISTINDVNKRRKFEQNFAQLTLEQQKGLDLKLLEAKSQTERLAILGQYLTQLNSQRIANLSSFYGEKEKAKRTNLLIIAGGVALLGVIVAIVLIKRNK
jgi:hypothetical protein